MKEELWIGVVWLKPLPGGNSDILDADVAGAFTNIVTWGHDAASFRRKAETMAADYNLYVVDIENAEPVSIRVLHSALNEEIEDLIRQAETNPPRYSVRHDSPIPTRGGLISPRRLQTQRFSDSLAAYFFVPPRRALWP